VLTFVYYLFTTFVVYFFLFCLLSMLPNASIYFFSLLILYTWKKMFNFFLIYWGFQITDIIVVTPKWVRGKTGTQINFSHLVLFSSVFHIKHPPIWLFNFPLLVIGVRLDFRFPNFYQNVKSGILNLKGAQMLLGKTKNHFKFPPWDNIIWNWKKKAYGDQKFFIFFIFFVFFKAQKKNFFPVIFFFGE